MQKLTALQRETSESMAATGDFHMTFSIIDRISKLKSVRLNKAGSVKSVKLTYMTFTEYTTKKY